MSKVLIIKLGYSETLDREISITSSLGDVLRTTVILNFFKKDNVTWLVDQKAYPLLDKNPYIEKILIFNLESVLQLQKERFDTVINLEKGPGICALADSVNAWRRYGFRFDENRGMAESYDGAEKVLNLALNLNQKRDSKKYWQEVLIDIIGKKWKNEEYVLGYKPKTKVKYDIGFNWAVGNKWPNKGWPEKHWHKLEKILKTKYTISWQKGLDNLYQYMDWINSCRLIVTNDSLGMHLAIALKKKIIVLFGPTSSKEVYLYGRGIKVVSRTKYNCVPCLKQSCRQEISCMELIKPELVKSYIEKILK